MFYKNLPSPTGWFVRTMVLLAVEKARTKLTIFIAKISQSLCDQQRLS